MRQYFTELEAAEAAGVSLDTIKEFITLGVLKLNPADAVYSQNYLTQADLIASFHSLKDLGVTVEIPKPPQEKPTAVAEAADPEPVAEQVEVTTSPASSVETDHGSTFIEHRSFELLDLNKALKDQIEILKQERDWLRTRVEKLEIRTERDQLLLMSETKTVQSLLPHHTERKGFWSLLPWLSGK
jgi:hypothetical protein